MTLLPILPWAPKLPRRSKSSPMSALGIRVSQVHKIVAPVGVGEDRRGRPAKPSTMPKAMAGRLGANSQGRGEVSHRPRDCSPQYCHQKSARWFPQLVQMRGSRREFRVPSSSTRWPLATARTFFIAFVTMDVLHSKSQITV